VGYQSGVRPPPRRQQKPTSLANNAGITPIIIDICCDILPQLFEYECASREVQRSKLAVRDCLRDDFWWRTWHELDDTGGHASFSENLVYDVI
jgi:hypothetical protein